MLWVVIVISFFNLTKDYMSKGVESSGYGRGLAALSLVAFAACGTTRPGNFEGLIGEEESQGVGAEGMIREMEEVIDQTGDGCRNVLTRVNDSDGEFDGITQVFTGPSGVGMTVGRIDRNAVKSGVIVGGQLNSCEFRVVDRGIYVEHAANNKLGTTDGACRGEATSTTVVENQNGVMIVRKGCSTEGEEIISLRRRPEGCFVTKKRVPPTFEQEHKVRCDVLAKVRAKVLDKTTTLLESQRTWAERRNGRK